MLWPQCSVTQPILLNGESRSALNEQSEECGLNGRIAPVSVDVHRDGQTCCAAVSWTGSVLPVTRGGVYPSGSVCLHPGPQRPLPCIF